MLSRRTLGRALLASVITLSVLSGLARPAGAVPVCDIAQFPSVQAAQSGLRFSCLLGNGGTAATNEVSGAFTFHDFQNAEYHQGAARTVKVTAAAIAGSGAITAAAGHFVAGDLNHPVSGVGVPARAFIKAMTATTITLNLAHLAIPLNTVLTVENSDARTVDNIVTVAASTTVTSATANFKTSDIGKSILASTLATGSTITAVATPAGGTSATVSLAALASTGAGYPAGCTTAPPLPTCNPPVATIGHTQAQSTTRSVADATNTTTTITSAAAVWRVGDVGLKVTGLGIPATAYIASFVGNVATIAGGPMTANVTAKNIVIGEPGATAPTNGSAVVQMMSQFDLNPAFAGGTGNCVSGIPESFVQQGTWRNPGSYLTAGVLGGQPAAGQSIAQIPCEDVGILIVDNARTTYTHSALNQIAQSDGVLVVCGDNHLPTAMLVPLSQHSQIVWRITSQIEASLPLRKKLWKQIVIEKVLRQASNLPKSYPAYRKLVDLAKRVQSGDTTNIEAQAAKIYWQNWLGQEEFRRDPGGDGLNGFLNYGYAIIRAAVARAIVAAGLSLAS